MFNAFSLQARTVPDPTDEMYFGDFTVWLSYTGAEFREHDQKGVHGVMIQTPKGDQFAIPGDLVAFDASGLPSIFSLKA